MTRATKGPTVVSVLNLKGGVGKTTVAVLLARYAAGHGSYGYRGSSHELNVLAVDLDPQANLSQALMGEQQYKQFMDGRESSIVELFNDYVPAKGATPGPTAIDDKVIRKIGDGLYIIPSRFDFSNKLIKSVRGADETTLARFLSRKAADKDLILIDCAPTDSILTWAAYHASRYVLIPVRPEFFPTIGFPLMRKSLKTFRESNHGHNIEVCGVLINKTKSAGSAQGPHRRASRHEIQQLAQECGWPILKEEMSDSNGYLDMVQWGSAHGNAKAGHEWPKVAEEILRKIGLDKLRRKIDDAQGT